MDRAASWKYCIAVGHNLRFITVNFTLQVRGVNRVLVHLQWIVKLVHLRSVEMFQIPISRSGFFSAPPRQISCKDILKQREFMNG